MSSFKEQKIAGRVNIPQRAWYEEPVEGRNPDARGIAISILLCFLFGMNMVFVKIAMDGITPIVLAGMRFSLGLIAILSYCFLKKIPFSIRRGEFSYIAILVLMFYIQILFMNLGLSTTLASRGSVIIHFYPIFVVLVSYFFIPEDRIGFTKTLAIIIAFIGIIAVFYDQLNIKETNFLRGDSFILVSAFLLGVQTVYIRRITQWIHPVKLVVWQMIFGVILFYLTGLLVESNPVFNFSIKIFIALLYQGIVVAGFCFVMWTALLKIYNANAISAIFFLAPIFGVIASILLRGEVISINLIIGTILVAASIYIINK